MQIKFDPKTGEKTISFNRTEANMMKRVRAITLELDASLDNVLKHTDGDLKLDVKAMREAEDGGRLTLE